MRLPNVAVSIWSTRP